VHIYTGVNAYDKFTPVIDFLDSGDPSPPLDLDGRIGLAYRSRWKEVYIKTGLPAVWDSIDQVRRMIGDPPLPNDPGRWWSGTEIQSLSDWPAVGLGVWPPVISQPTAKVSLAANVIKLYDRFGLSKIDSSGRPINKLSLRTALDTATLKSKVPPEKLEAWWGDLESSPLNPP
jgi:hypothetical protein